MHNVIARVTRVLTGHSPTAQIHAIDEHGHEHRLEIPAELAVGAEGVAVGRLLVLQWSVHGLPGADATTVEVVPRAETAPVADVRPTTASGVIESTPERSDSATDLETLLGLRPGILRGSGDMP